jgi:autotransporter-associated beta strand protein
MMNSLPATSVLISAALLTAATISNAAPVANEDFTYLDGDLAGNNGGSGWNAAWANVSVPQATVSAGLATFTCTSNGSFSSSETARTLPTVGAGTTTWIRINGQLTVNGFVSDSFGGIGLYADTTERALLGKDWPGANNWTIKAHNNSGGGTQVSSSTIPLTDGMADVWVKIVNGPATNDDTMSLWVNPADFSSEAALGSALASLSGRHLDFNTIRLRGGSSTTGHTATWTFDNLKVGGDFADVAVVGPVVTPSFHPPPGTYVGVQTVTLFSENGSTVHYTTDGSTPTDASPAGTAGTGTATVTLGGPAAVTLKAIAFISGRTSSAIAQAQYQFAAVGDGIWVNPTDGLWMDPANWRDSSIGAGADRTASFVSELTRNTKVTLASDISIGGLSFGGTTPRDWLLEGVGVLSLENGTASPQISVTGKAALIGATLTGSNGFTKTGDGTLTLTGANTLNGTIILNGGTLIVWSSQNSLRPLGGGHMVINNGLLETKGPNAGVGDAAALKSITLNGGGFTDLSAWGTLIGRLANTTGSVTVNGGTLTSNPSNNGLWVGGDGTGTLTVAGGTVSATRGIGIGVNAGSNGTLNLTGGTIRTTAIRGGAGGGTSHTITLGGGTLEALENTTSFFENIATATTLGDSTTTIHNTGHAVTIAQVLAGQGGLTFRGGGITTLVSGQSYTGATAVVEGTLRVNGSTAPGSAVSVSAGAILGGTGNVGGITNVAGFIAPGAGIGTLTTGNLTLAGTYVCEISGTNADRLTVNGDIDLTGATLLPIPLAFATQDSFIIATYSGTRTGQFVNVPAGYQVDYSVPHEVRLKVNTGYGTWVSAHFPGVTQPAIIHPDADPDGDGIDNGIEFLTGTLPADNASHSAPATVFDATGEQTVSFRRVVESKSSEVAVEVGTDLRTWLRIVIPNSAVTSPGVTVVTNGSAPDDITVVVAADTSKKFTRVRIGGIPALPGTVPSPESDGSTVPGSVSSGLQVWPSPPPPDNPFAQSADIAGIGISERRRNYTAADTWYPTWASNGKMYSPFTDGSVNGTGASSGGGASATTGAAVIDGDDPLNLSFAAIGVHGSSALPYAGRYPCGSLVHNGIWYYGTYCLHGANYVEKDGIGYNWPYLGPFVGFRTSTNYGQSWTETPRTASNPLFGEQSITPAGNPLQIGKLHFVDFGKNMEHSPDGKAYLVSHGASDGMNRRFGYNSWVTGDAIYLIRVTPSVATINDPSQYEFFDGTGWTGDFSRIQPIAAWRDRMGCVSMTYNAPLRKYLMCVNDGQTTMSRFNTYILESSNITGPWKMVQYMEHFGEQAYFVNIPSKFISTDGLTFWLCYSANFTNGWMGPPHPVNPPGASYHMCLQEMKISGN